jgi:hypothetical protein
MPCVTELIELLKKIAKSKDHVHIEIDYDGVKFKWEVPQRNLTASEWTPRSEKSAENEDKHTREPITETTHGH